jgi:ubiquinone/menaquinone biosynthesis C-methylase UbiE
VKEMRRKDAMKILIEYYTTVSEEWDRYVVPFTGVFAEEVVQAAQIKPKYHVLDVGTGTGVAALLLASAVSSQGRVVGVDLAEGMLRVAREKAKKAGYQYLSFKVMDAQDLDFPTRSFDVVISNIAFPIKEKKALRQVYRVLKDNGRFSFSIGRIERTETEKVFRSIFSKYKVPQPSVQLERERQAKRFESDKVDPERLKSLFKEVGFQNLTMRKKTHKIVLSGPEAYIDMMIPFDYVSEVAEMPPSDRREFMDELRAGLGKLMQPDGLILKPELNYYLGTK